jgi:hypothetical protein
LGTNQLKIDDDRDKSLPLEVLSRGTREAVFIALRLSLAAAYARRGVMLPLVLDDVLVNFDRDRAMSAALTLKTFSELGHQVMMFTCHEHIVEIFHDIDVEVRMMPPQGEPGRATILLPGEMDEEEEEYEEEEYQQDVEEQVLEERAEEQEPEPEVEPEPVVVAQHEPEPEPEPKIVYVEKPRPKRKKRQPVKVKHVEPEYAEHEDIEPEYVEPEYVEPEYVEEDYSEPEPLIGWAWFEREPIERLAEVEEALDSVVRNDWIDDGMPQRQDPVPEDVWNRNDSWWGGSQPANS